MLRVFQTTEVAANNIALTISIFNALLCLFSNKSMRASLFWSNAAEGQKTISRRLVIFYRCLVQQKKISTIIAVLLIAGSVAWIAHDIRYEMLYQIQYYKWYLQPKSVAKLKIKINLTINHKIDLSLRHIQVI